MLEKVINFDKIRLIMTDQYAPTHPLIPDCFEGKKQIRFELNPPQSLALTPSED